MSALAPLLQAYFTDRLARQRDASPHTIASYRDSFRLLLTFLHEQTGTPPSKLQLEDLDPARISAFLSHLENERGNSVRTRNARLTAIHSFFHFAALKAPECSEQIARVLSIAEKRYQSTLINYLTKPEINALLAAPNRSTATGRRDHALLLLAVQTGLRASELAGLRCQDLNLASGAWVRCDGKGRKERCTPLTRVTVQVLRVWLRELGGDPAGPLFPSRTGGHLTRAGIWRLVAKHATTACARRPSLAAKNITPHTCATPQRCNCSALPSRSIPPRSPCGSGTKRSTPPTSICTPTWNSNDGPSTAPHRQTSSPDATAHPTDCSRSSRASDRPKYVAITSPISSTGRCGERQRNIVRDAT